MNHYNLQLLANDQLNERLAEAERSRKARSGYEASLSKQAKRTRQPRRGTASLSSLFHRVAFF